MPKLIDWLVVVVVVVIAGIAGKANAAMVRYDLNSFFRGNIGYMVFEGTAPGNIAPNLIDWSFDMIDVVISPSNTKLDSISVFNVDANWDYVPGDNVMCFSSTGSGCVTAPEPVFAFGQFSIYPSGSGFFKWNGEEEVAYHAGLNISAPTVVPLPPSITFFAIALVGLALRVRRRWRSGIDSWIQSRAAAQCHPEVNSFSPC